MNHASLASPVIIIMGVSGSGKTTVGRLLAERLALPYFDADTFHSVANIAKMQAGSPLTDDDRSDWLAAMARAIGEWQATAGAVLACSALKESYRQTLRREARHPLQWIFLDGAPELVRTRLQARRGHYMGAALLDSQYAALEKPAYGLALALAIDSAPDHLVDQIMTYLQGTAVAGFGLIGLGVMGKSLALNLAEKGVPMALYNRHVPDKEVDVARQIVAENAALGPMVGFDNLAAFVAALTRPRKIMLMVTAGPAVDAQLAELLPLLSPGDVLIDGGNSYYQDSARRAEELASHGLHFIGAGVSGGEQGARRGPSIMPGGSPEGYALVADYFERLAAKDARGVPCTAYMGPGGAGHFVKMVHNGIEYAEMQLLAEVYQLLRHLHCPPAEMVACLRAWQAEPQVSSYLLGITLDILQVQDGNDLLLEKVLDQAAQKGTGGWTVQAALNYGIPLSMVTEAVQARGLSSFKAARVQAAALYPAPAVPSLTPEERAAVLGQLKNAYQAARILNHACGFQLLQGASVAHGWRLNLSSIARIWTNGCIIRSGLMEQLSPLLQATDDLLTAPALVAELQARRPDFAAVVAQGLARGVALPVLSAALNYLLGYTTADSPANLIQAQRDYFGAHTFRRTDRPATEVFHANWQA